jgi:hypothetical protein
MKKQYNLTITKSNLPDDQIGDNETITISTTDSSELKRMLDLAGVDNEPESEVIQPQITSLPVPSIMPPMKSTTGYGADYDASFADHEDEAPEEDEIIEDSHWDYGHDEDDREHNVLSTDLPSKPGSNYPLRITNKYGDNDFAEEIEELMAVFPNGKMLVEGTPIKTLVMAYLSEAKAKLGSGTKMKHLVRSLAAKGAKDPKALAAWIGRKVHGDRQMNKWAKAGRAHHEEVSYAAKVQNDSLKKWRPGAALNEEENDKLNEICELVENHDANFVNSITKLKAGMVEHINEREITQLASVFVNLLLQENSNKLLAIHSVFRSLNDNQLINLYKDYLDEAVFDTSVYYKKHGMQPSQVFGSKRWGFMIGESIKHFDGTWDEIKISAKKHAEDTGFIGEIKVLS